MTLKRLHAKQIHIVICNICSLTHLLIMPCATNLHAFTKVMQRSSGLSREDDLASMGTTCLINWS